MYKKYVRRKIFRLFLPLFISCNVTNIFGNSKFLKKIGFFFSPFFLDPIFKETHPENPNRIKLAVTRIKVNAFLKKNIIFFPIRSVSENELLLIHTSIHINKIRKTYGKRIDKIARTGVGAVLSACDCIIEGKISRAFVASRPPGHHAINYGREEGFCFYNNISIATKYLQKKGFRKILIIDWDYHHGDGTEHFFYDDPSVMFFSTHDWSAYPGTGDPSRKGKGKGKGYNINIHLPCGSNNSDIERAFLNHLKPKALDFAPDFVLISAGFDSRDGDLLGCFKINDEGYRNLTKITSEISNQSAGGRIISILEGGYNPNGVASSVETHIEELILSY
tara:strand:- start:2929 stop:3933 length:1005 start_codon:yes stop_codon:yes gene_type:complete